MGRDVMAEEMISVMVNGEPRAVAPGRSVAEYLEELGLRPELIVVEHNREILERSAYPGTGLRDGDILELVHFVGGG
jgi:thiamine biosynthesis protein ThiS